MFLAFPAALYIDIFDFSIFSPKHSLGSGNILAFGYSMRPCSIDKSGRNLGIIGVSFSKK
jgi:hypothetical protein